MGLATGIRSGRMMAAMVVAIVMLAVSVAAPPIVRAGTPTTTTVDVPAGMVYGEFQVTAHVRPAPQSDGGYIPAVTITVDGGNGLPSPIDANGDATMMLTLTPGTHQVVASFGPFGEWDASESAPAGVEVGVATSLALTSSLNPALHSEAVTITATVTPAEGTISGGTVTIVDEFDGSTIASGQVGPSTTSIAVTRTFATGSHVLRATYGGNLTLGPSDATLTQEITADSDVKATGLSVQYSTFYPVKDGYRDTVAVRGTLGETARVVIRVYSPTGRLVRTSDLGLTAPGPYSWAWNGRNATGTLATAGKYKVTQTVVDTVANRLTATHFVTLSRKSLKWSTHTITKAGDRYGGYWDGGNGWVKQSRSSYATGVRLSSGSSFVAVRYTFALRSAVVYKPLSFKVLGRSPNGTGGIAGLWNRTLGASTNVLNYDVRAVGPGYKWYSISLASATHRRGLKAYGAVIVYNGGRAALFDIAKVRLVYRYAVLR
jgi:hypothetical protein